MPLKIIRKYPVVKTMASYLCINMTADFSEQVFIKKHTRDTYDVAKTVRIGSFGCFFLGPMIYNWIRFIDRMIPGKTLVMVIKKVACDSCLFAPVAISTFYLTTNILEGKRDITEEWKEKFFKTWRTGLMYWPFVQSVNFAFIPLHYKTSVYMPFCSFIWMNFMCFMKDKKMRPNENVPNTAEKLHGGGVQILAKEIPAEKLPGGGVQILAKEIPAEKLPGAGVQILAKEIPAEKLPGGGVQILAKEIPADSPKK